MVCLAWKRKSLNSALVGFKDLVSLSIHTVLCSALVIRNNTLHTILIFKKRGWHWQPGTERGQRILGEKYLSCLWIAERGRDTGTE